MTEFTFELNTRIYYGTNIVKKSLEKEKEWLQGNILIVTTGRSLIRLGYLEQLITILKSINVTGNIVVYDQISQNPKLTEVKQAVQLGREHEVNVVIGFGGGSALDAAKAAAAGIPSVCELDEYLLQGKEPDENVLPVIAIPTTAGTGSELSKAAILSSPEHHLKGGIRGKYMIPKVAIVDAAYTWSIPRKVTLETGFDVLAHAIESFVAVKSNLYSEMLSEKAIKIVGECIPRLCQDLNDHVAREKMSFASMIMGMNLANVGTAFPHRMQYPIGANTQSSHGAGLIALYPSWISHEFEVNQEKVILVMEWLGYRNMNSVEMVRECFADFLKKTDMKYKLADFGLGVQEASEMTGQVTGNLANDRLSGIENMIETIYMESL